MAEKNLMTLTVGDRTFDAVRAYRQRNEQWDQRGEEGVPMESLTVKVLADSPVDMAVQGPVRLASLDGETLVEWEQGQVTSLHRTEMQARTPVFDVFIERLAPHFDNGGTDPLAQAAGILDADIRAARGQAP